MNKYLQKIVDSRLVQAPVELSKQIVIPGFDGLPLYDVLEFFITGLLKNSLSTRAASLAFRFFLALFPLIIFLFSLIPYIPIANFHEELLDLIRQVLPDNAFNLAQETITDLMSNKSKSLLSFGFIFAFYLASNGVKSMIIAFNESYHAIKKGNFIKNYLISFLILIILICLMIVAISLIIFSDNLTGYIISYESLNNSIVLFIMKLVKFILLLLLFFLGISSIYYFGNIKGGKFRFISAGSSLATLLSILITMGFAYYVNNFSTYNKVYGSIGTLIVVMLWLYFNSLVLLIGYELNASISHARARKTKLEYL
ncbi:MAG: YihY/virulence factor BrkB family protein [Flavobacteriales bacterium]|nr:YihY/virulence factor BrkB family protein [Flavobacteriales bacterium]